MGSRGVGLYVCLAYIIIETVTGLKSDFLYPLTLEESKKQEFVDSHNHFRRLVSKPEGANMRLMTWDEELAKLARNHVRKCKFGHSTPAELVTADFPKVGENVYAGDEFYYDEFMTTIGVTKKWYDEVEHFNYTDLSCAADEICGHYTQLVWAGSYKVGCAMAKCKKIEGGNPSYLVTCAYGPGGNHYLNGKPLSPYKSGEACSACGDGDLCIDQLCNNTKRDIPPTTTAPDVTTIDSTTKSSTVSSPRFTTANTTETSSTTTKKTEETDQPLICYQCANCVEVTDADLVVCPATTKACVTKFFRLTGSVQRRCESFYPTTECIYATKAQPVTSCFCNTNKCNTLGDRKTLENLLMTTETTTSGTRGIKTNNLLPSIVTALCAFVKIYY